MVTSVEISLYPLSIFDSTFDSTLISHFLIELVNSKLYETAGYLYLLLEFKLIPSSNQESLLNHLIGKASTNKGIELSISQRYLQRYFIFELMAEEEESINHK